jgi:hypothetical protein
MSVESRTGRSLDSDRVSCSFGGQLTDVTAFHNGSARAPVTSLKAAAIRAGGIHFTILHWEEKQGGIALDGHCSDHLLPPQACMTWPRMAPAPAAGKVASIVF